MDWQAIDRFPAATGEWAFVRPPRRTIRKSKDQLESVIRQWSPFDPLLVSTPESNRFLPPICVPALMERVHTSVLHRYRLLIAGIFLFSLVFAGAWLAGAGDGNKLLRLTLALMLFDGFLALDFTLVLRNRRRLLERSLFVSWIYDRRTPIFVILVLTVVLAGLVQLCLQAWLGDLDALVTKYGLLYVSAESGEFWRYATGPFIHAGVVHWISNLSFMVVAAGLIGRVARISMLGYFLAIVVLSAASTSLIPIGTRFDAMVGVSGGVLGLFGWLAGASFRNSSKFPSYLWVTASIFAALTIGSSLLLKVNSSNVAHVIGFALGAAFGVANLGLRTEFVAGGAEVPGVLSSPGRHEP